MHVSPILLSGAIEPLAYLDPGSGSILLQLVIAAVLGVGLFLRSQWARVKRWFGGKPTEDIEISDDDTYEE